MQLSILANDEWLRPFAPAIEHRHRKITGLYNSICDEYGSLLDFASAHHYYGLHANPDGSLTLREWAPNATEIYVIGQFSDWLDDDRYAMQRTADGNWEITLPAGTLAHTDHYKLSVHWNGGSGQRLPAYASRVVQDPNTLLFDAQVWTPDKPFAWTDRDFCPPSGRLLIYEAHIGMSSEQETVATFDHFTRHVLPYIAELGYNVVQIMAIQEHPYYGSFGYHVSNFFAASSRFGTPEDLKLLVDTAHRLGIAVVMDIVHSHAVRNENEGLSRFDGTTDLYFHYGPRGDHPAWDSRCFDYGKPQVQRFLLSNVRYWMEEYHIDGFRFDGVTSMLYLNHGLGKDFTSYADYFDGNEDEDALAYLAMANRVAHLVNPRAITIAEEMSGYPGIAGSIDAGGIGFDYRLSMGVPDYWIKLIKEQPDEKWPVGKIYYELTQHRPEEKTINYAESHDQALVGDKTIIFRLMDAAMYDSMETCSNSMTVDRGMALHKMIRLVTLFTSSGGYLNFMGNEFGHPEWIDFPRQGNDWSYKYARRQWSLAQAPNLRYHLLLDFDKAMIELFAQTPADAFAHRIYDNDQTQVLAFMRGDYLLIFNFSPTNSYTNYGIYVPQGRYSTVLSTDEKRFGGFERNDMFFVYYSQPMAESRFMLSLYLPARTAMVLQRREMVHIR